MPKAKHIHRLQKATIGYDIERGVAILSIKDPEMFPNGFLYEFPRDAYPTAHVRQQLVGGLSDEEWTTQADEGYQVSAKHFNPKSMSEDRLRILLQTEWHPSLYLGCREDGVRVHHEPFGLSSAGIADERGVNNTEGKSLLVHGPSGSGKTMLLDFLYRQYSFVNPRRAVLVRFDLQNEGSPALVFDPSNRSPKTVDSFDALSELYSTTGPMVVFADNLDSANGANRAIAGALESLIRTRENWDNLSFVVSKQQITNVEARYYRRVIEAEGLGGKNLGVYTTTSPNSPKSVNTTFRTPSIPMMESDLKRVDWSNF